MNTGWNFMDKFYLELFYSECPAIPTYHVSALENIEIKKSVSIYVTHQCNLRCKTCYLNAGLPLKYEMKLDNYKNIFPKIKNLGFELIYILGGEPLLHKEIFEIISLAKENDFVVSMSSNGFFIDKIKAEKLKKSGLDQIQISIDSANEMINDNIRGDKSFKNAINAIKNLKNVGLKVSIAFTITKYYNNVEEMVRLAKSLDVDVLNVSVVQPFGRAKENDIAPDKHLIKEAIEKLKMYKNEIKLTFNGFRFYLNKKIFDESLKNIPMGYNSCPAGKERFVIDSNGNIYGCELLMNEYFLEGNVLKDDINKIWESGFKLFRERVIPEYCNHCNFKQSCQGGCPARSFSTDLFQKKDSLCYF